MSSSTSDRVATGDRLLGWLRLTHPFPSILDGLVSGSAALVAGAPLDLAFRLGFAMTLLQLGIGTVNDVVDAPADAGRKAGKPIPSGLVSGGQATVAAAILFIVGTSLALSVSPALAGLAVLVVAIGLAYDLLFKGTAWSWLPFAVGIPILPVFGWLGSTGGLAPAFTVLLPAAVAAGAGLAIGNALVDVERDRSAGLTSIAIVLGPVRARVVAAILFGAVGLAAVWSAVAATRPIPVVLLLAIGALVPVSASLASSSPSTARRERAWQFEAVGLAVVGTLWLALVIGGGHVA
ncbi:MAG TPA: UbiA family prenyltransferase [Patescibacteria group bacterium]|nr:UbiA family prenyltransferase [Patescibacteria group bacterium]